MTEKEFQGLQNRVGGIAEASAAAKHQKFTPKRVDPVCVAGPVDVTLVLYGHCPSKKNLWQRGAAGKMFLDSETKSQIGILTTQALFQWKGGAPVEHPDITVKFYVNAARRDRDGMLVTLLDCLQQAGVIVNDNHKRCNGRIILEPSEFVSESEERVDARVQKQ